MLFTFALRRKEGVNTPSHRNINLKNILSFSVLPKIFRPKYNMIFHLAKNPFVVNIKGTDKVSEFWGFTIQDARVACVLSGGKGFKFMRLYSLCFYVVYFSPI